MDFYIAGDIFSVCMDENVVQDSCNLLVNWYLQFMRWGFVFDGFWRFLGLSQIVTMICCYLRIFKAKFPLRWKWNSGCGLLSYVFSNFCCQLFKFYFPHWISSKISIFIPIFLSNLLFVVLVTVASSFNGTESCALIFVDCFATIPSLRVDIILVVCVSLLRVKGFLKAYN